MYKSLIILFCVVFIGDYATQAKEINADEYYCTQNAGVNYCLNENGEPLNGKRTVSGEKGYELMENYKNGYQDGLSTYWDEDGELAERAYFSKGVKNGMDKIYYPNRSIKFLANYKNGVLDGRLDIYSPEGKLLGRVTYKDGYVKKGECVGSKGRKTDLTTEQAAGFGYNKLVTCGAQ